MPGKPVIFRTGFAPKWVEFLAGLWGGRRAGQWLDRFRHRAGHGPWSTRRRAADRRAADLVLIYDKRRATPRG